VKIKLIFAWYDFWVGVFYDREKRRIYVFPLPMLGLMIQLRPPWKRDPEFDCCDFEVGPPNLLAQCDTDGHYRCGECIWNEKRLKKERP